MPISKHFGGHGEEVMSNMMNEYGREKAERVFYATENKQKNKKKKKPGKKSFGFGK